MATSYDIFRSTASGAEGTAAVETGVTATSYTNTGLTNGVAYYYKVAAVNAAGTSALSAEVHATPKLVVPSVPTGLIAGSGDAEIGLLWTASNAASSYNIY